MRTDPRRDREYVTKLNTRHNSLILPTILLLKHWLKRPSKPGIPSYYFEMLCCRVFSQVSQPFISVQAAIQYFFANAGWYVLWPLADPKNLGPALDNGLGMDIKNSFLQAINTASSYANDAIIYEQRGQVEPAIGAWRNVFGSQFPAYG